MYSQSILDVYPIDSYTSPSVYVEGNIIGLSSIPFEGSYIIELTSEVYIHNVIVDEIADSLSMYAYLDGHWVYFEVDRQTVVINQTIRYLMVRYLKRSGDLYLLIEF